MEPLAGCLRYIWMNKKSSHVIVKTHHPVRLRVILTGLVVGIVLGGWTLFDYGRDRAGFDSGLAVHERDMLRKRIEELVADNNELRGQTAILVQAAEIDRQAYDEVDATLRGLQTEILDLKQEVDFYRGIVSPKGGQGLRIQEFSMTRNGETQSYRYKLVLSQFVKNQRLIKGLVRMTIYGMQGEGQKALVLKDVSQPGRNSIGFRFKFFQELEGNIVLPEDFEPLRVEVQAAPETKRLKNIKKMFSWPELLS